MDEIKSMLLEIKGDIRDMKESLTQNNKEEKNLREQIKTLQDVWKKEKRRNYGPITNS